MKKKDYEEKLLKYRLLLKCTSDWLKVKQEGRSLVDFFVDNKLKNIAIYGYGTLGQMFYEELRNTEVKVEYIIDKKFTNDKLKDIQFMGVGEQEYKNVDAIVITAIADYSEIEREISKKTNAFIYSFEDVIEY